MKIRLSFKKLMAVTLTATLIYGLLYFTAVPGTAAAEPPKKSDIFKGVQSVVSITDDRNLPEYSVPGNGVFVQTRGFTASFKYKGLIDAECLVADIPLISFQVLGGIDSANVQRAEIKLTDAFDISNSVSLVYNPSIASDNYGKHCYARVLYKGSERGRSSDLAVSTLFVNRYGTLANHRRFLPHKWLADATQAQIFSTAYDNASKTFYAKGWEWNKVLTLDDEEDVGVGNQWKGFASGVITMEVIFEFDSAAMTGGIIVTEFMGQSLSGNMTEAEKKVPVINIKTEKKYLTKEMPIAAKGIGYEIPQAYASEWYDGAHKANVTIKDSNGNDVTSLMDNNIFTAGQTGRYSINYEHTTSLNKKSTAILYFNVIDTLPRYFVALKSDIKPTLYSDFIVPQIDVVGGSGILEYSEKLTYNGKEIPLTAGRNVFIDKKGVLSLSIVVQGYTGDSYAHSVNYKVAAQQVNISVRGVPEYVQSNVATTLPKAYVYDGDLNQLKDADIYVDGNKLSADRVFTTQKKSGSSVTIRYQAGEGESAVVREYTVTVIGGTSLLDYIISKDNLSVALGSDGLSVAIDYDTSFSMPMPLALSDFSLQFSLANADLTALDIIFDDYMSIGNTTFLRIRPVSRTLSTLQVNGIGELYPINYGYGTDGYNLILDGYKSILYDGSGRTICSFYAAPSNTAFLSFKVMGVTNGNTFKLSQVSNQIFNPIVQSNGDKSGPVLVTDKVIKEFEELSINQTFYTYGAMGLDVLSGLSAVTLTVTDPDDNILYSGAALDMAFKADKYGYYSIIYTSKDAKNNTSYNEFYLHIVDEIPPVFASKPDIPATVKTGDTITFPVVRVTDNIDGESSYQIIVLDTITYKQDIVYGSYKFLRAGTYKVIYLSVDSVNNIATMEYTVYVVDGEDGK